LARKPKAVKNVARAAAFLLAKGGRPIVLEAEVAASRQEAFARDYSSWTGKATTWSALRRKGSVTECGEGKWGIESRIYFPADAAVRTQMERYGFAVESGGVRHPETSRINSNELFRVLVEADGLRLGPNV